MQAIWSPQLKDVQNSLMTKFMSFATQRYGKEFSDYETLHQWSVSEMAEFWDAVWDFCNILGNKGCEIIQEVRHVPYARFFPDSKISFTENLLAYQIDHPDAPAIIARHQNNADRVITWQALSDQVSLWQQVFESLGVGEGDKVALYLPNIPETVSILLAVSNIGAVFASAGMEMGQADLISRFSQLEPKVIVTQKDYVHGTKTIDRIPVISQVKNAIRSVEKVILLGEEADTLLATFSPQPLTFVRRNFNHPLYILFSSGSTGQPKCFEHSTGGVLLKHLVEFRLHSDVKPGDRVFYHSTPSWMMWNWLASGLASGATILMYDGDPFYPDTAVQWNFTATHQCTHHGTAAPIILEWEKAKLNLSERNDLNSLRVIMSTGAVLPAQSYKYLHTNIKRDMKIGSISGGTDLVGCFLGGNPLLPTYPGQINSAILGSDVAVWDEQGVSLPNGQAGELVCQNAFPSMPLRLLNDPNRTRYTETYFQYYPNQKVWRHGDTIEKTTEGQFIVTGRSDATLNQNGVRIGPAVIYEQLEAFADEILDYAAIDFMRPDNQQTITVLFLVCDSLPDELCKKIKMVIKENITPYAIPTEIIKVPAILKTPNGKKAEVVMKKIIAEKEIPNASLYGENLVCIYQKIGQSLKQKYST